MVSTLVYLRLKTSMDALKNWLYSSFSEENTIPADLINIIKDSKIPNTYLSRHLIYHRLSETLGYSARVVNELLKQG